MEYAEIDNSANQSPQHLNLPSGYNVINDNNINVNTELQVHKCTKLLMYLSKIRTYIQYIELYCIRTYPEWGSLLSKNILVTFRKSNSLHIYVCMHMMPKSKKELCIHTSCIDKSCALLLFKS